MIEGNIREARRLMERARETHFAVSAFNVDNQETLIAIVRAAQVKEAPVLVEVSHAEAEVIGLANMSAVPIAAGIFLDIFKVFLLFVELFSGGRE